MVAAGIAASSSARSRRRRPGFTKAINSIPMYGSARTRPLSRVTRMKAPIDSVTSIACRAWMPPIGSVSQSRTRSAKVVLTKIVKTSTNNDRSRWERRSSMCSTRMEGFSKVRAITSAIGDSSGSWVMKFRIATKGLAIRRKGAVIRCHSLENRERIICMMGHLIWIGVLGVRRYQISPLINAMTYF